jgi:hypothetical protein
MFMRGGACSELVFDLNGKDVVDLAVPDPCSLRFEQIKDPVLGTQWRIYQWQQQRKVILDVPTFRYIPLQPALGKPFGRPMVSPALFVCLFLMTLLLDLKRVIKQQGYPRLDLSIDFARLREMMPEDIEGDPLRFKEFVDGVVDSVVNYYKNLKPDDAYVHDDTISVNRPVGAVDSSSLGAVDALFKALERMATRALKTMPLMMATTDGVSEANANRQWEIYVAGIKSIQHLIESMMEYHLTFALRAQGLRAHVQWRFAELRAAELLRDAQVQALKTQTAKLQYEQGWISQNEAAQLGANKEKADVESPRIITGYLGGNLTTTQAEPGSNRVIVPSTCVLTLSGKTTEKQTLKTTEKMVYNNLSPPPPQPPPPNGRRF